MIFSRAILVVAILAVIFFLILTGDGYQLYIIALVGLTAIVGIGLNVLLGMTGQISLGHVGFYAIGAYSVAILTAKFGWNFWVALPAAGLIAGGAGVLLAIPALRVRGPYLAMVTIAFGFVVEQSAAEFSGLTGGWNGISGIPMPRAFGVVFSEREIAFFVLALTAISLWLFSRLSRSPWGKAMRAVRDSEIASQSIGLNLILIRTTAFGVSAIAAGLAGGVFAAMSDFISPESFPFFQSILFLLVVMVGGTDRVLGPLIGAVIVVLLPEILSSLAEYRLLFVGILLFVVLRLAPGGFVGLLSRIFERPKTSTVAEQKRDVMGYLTSGQVGPALSIVDLSISFGGVHAVKSVSFDARPGEVTSLIGPNGAGKSTVLNLLCGFYLPVNGTVRFGDRDISRLPSHRIAQAGIARTYQTSQLFGNMSVLDNVLIALRCGHLGATKFFSLDDDPDVLAMAESLLAFVGYRGSLEQAAGALAHVDKRLVEIARALAIRPSVLALDEPAAGLDSQDTERVGQLLRKVADVGIAVVLVEHDMHLVMTISNRVVVLDAGLKIADGPPAQIAVNPDVLKAYLGEEKPTDRGRKLPCKPGATTLISTKKLRAGYGLAPVLHDLELHVDEGEFVAVLGANGAGKSTLMRALSGLNRTVEGEVLFLGERVERFTANRIAERGLILVPEGRQVFPELSVIDNLKLGTYARPFKGSGQMIEQMLERFPHLRARQNQRAGFLSGGEQQMLAIARGLMARPRILMLDEPSLGLAPKLLEELYDLLAELREAGTTILLVDQMAALALSVADRAYVLQSGTIAQSGTAAELRADPAVARAYLGEH